MPTCPTGHASVTEDYCDQCGVRLSPTAPSASAVASPVAEPCPRCGYLRNGRYCEACGFDFVAGGTGGWAAVVEADRKYHSTLQDDIPFPNECPQRRFPLHGNEIRIGRSSASRGIAPELDLAGPPLDSGISHLHAVLQARPDGGFNLTDLGSTNGTRLNSGKDPIPPNVAVPVGDGDRIHVGAWTTITIAKDSQ